MNYLIAKYSNIKFYLHILKNYKAKITILYFCQPHTHVYNKRQSRKLNTDKTTVARQLQTVKKTEDSYGQVPPPKKKEKEKKEEVA